MRIKKYSNYIYWGLLLVNIVFALYFTSGWLFATPGPRIISGSLLTENSSVRAEILKLAENSGNTPVAVGLMSSSASICVENKLVNFFKKVREEKPGIKLYILFPKNISDQDISTFKENFSLDFDVLRMSPELENQWEPLSQQYKTEGVIILSNQNNLFASENMVEIKKAMDAY